MFFDEKGNKPVREIIQNRYPWAQMKIGDSFFVSCTCASKLKGLQGKLKSLGDKWGARPGNNNAKFRTERRPGGVLVIRIA